MEPEPLNGTSGEGAGQEEQTESPEDAAQVTLIRGSILAELFPGF